MVKWGKKEKFKIILKIFEKITAEGDLVKKWTNTQKTGPSPHKIG